MQIELLPHAYFQGAIVPVDQAKVSIATHALQYGTGAFAGIRGYLDASGESINIFRLADHARRFMDSARLLRADVALDAAGIARVIEDLVLKNNPDRDVYIRPLVYKSAIELTPHLKGVESDIAIYMIPMGDYLAMDRPVNLFVSAWVRSNDNTIPSRGKITGAYINSALARDQAEEAGYDDALMMNSRGKVAEASGANFFIIRHGVLISSPVTGDILEGITRRSVIQFAGDLGVPVEVRDIDRSELYIAEEAFVCGTGAQIAPVGTIDGRPVGDGNRGPITGQLQDLFFNSVRGKDGQYGHYLTRVPIHG